MRSPMSPFLRTRINLAMCVQGRMELCCLFGDNAIELVLRNLNGSWPASI